MQQRTLAEKVSCTGIGLHSGAPVQLTLRPARVGTGVVFVRTDGPQRVEIPARPSAVRSTRLATTLGAGATTLSTVEHLLAALSCLSIDNVRVEVDGPELPVMDGSSAPFVYLIRSAGTFSQPERRPMIRVRRALEYRDGARRIRIEPARELSISYAVDFDHPVIGRQEIRFDSVDAKVFEREIAPARTFGFLREVRELWSAGFARGGSLANTVVLDDGGVMNEEGLRFRDEFVRHKVLDLLGDLALLGMPLCAHVEVERGGHAIHHGLLAQMLERREDWRIVDPRSSRGLRAPRRAVSWQRDR